MRQILIPRQTLSFHLSAMLRLIQISNLELDSYLERTIANNPYLVFVKRGQESFRGETDFASQPVSLYEHINRQIGVSFHLPRQRACALFLLDHLDPDGYFKTDLQSLKTDYSLETLETTLDKLQQLEPPGIFARSLEECFLLQLRERDSLTPTKIRVIDNLSYLAKGQLVKLRRACQVSESTLLEIIHELRSLVHKPAMLFDSGAPVFFPRPELFVFPAQNDWLIDFYSETLPKITLDPEAIRMSRCGAIEEKSYRRQHLTEAKWLIRSLEQRTKTILKVARSIVYAQDAFLRQGDVTLLNPLRLETIAADTGLSISTVSRAIKNKIIETPQGIFDLKFFLSSTRDHKLSRHTMKYWIKSMIEGETVDDVLSDVKIAQLLKRKGIGLDRRSVTEYRQQLRISTFAQRRHEKKLSQILTTWKQDHRRG